MNGLTTVRAEHRNSAAEECGCRGKILYHLNLPIPRGNHTSWRTMGEWSRCVQYLDHTIAGALQRLSSHALYDSHGLITALPIWDNSQGHVSGHRKAPCTFLSFPNSNHTSRGAICPLYRTWASWFGHMHRACVDLAQSFLFPRCHKIQWVVYVLGPWFSLPWKLLQWGRRNRVWQRSSHLRKEEGMGE